MNMINELKSAGQNLTRNVGGGLSALGQDVSYGVNMIKDTNSIKNRVASKMTSPSKPIKPISPTTPKSSSSYNQGFRSYQKMLNEANQY